MISFARRRPLFALALAAAPMALGCGDSSVLFSNPGTSSAGEFVVAPAVPVHRDRARHSATLLGAGEVLICGGVDSGGAFIGEAERYRASPAPRFERTRGGLVRARAEHTATLLADGRVLLAGGTSQAGVEATAELYDPATDRFAQAAGSLAAARRGHTARLVGGGSVIVAGGDPMGAPLDSVERFDPATGTFAPAGALQTARTRHSATLTVRDTLLVAGGFGPQGQSLASVEIYDPATATSRAARGGLNTARGGHAAVSLLDGRILIVGGLGSGPRPLDTAEVYDPVNERSTNVRALLSKARHPLEATLLFDGRVLITGPDDTAEIFDGATSTFLAAGTNLAQPRSYHTATLLRTLEVLIFGGGPSFAPAELFLDR